MDKVIADVNLAVTDIADGSSVAVGGFGLCGVPSTLIEALHMHGVHDLEVVSNNCGTDEHGLGLLLKSRQIRRVIASYIGENKEFSRQYLAGELEVELCPQGSLAERLRAGGAGIPAFYTATGQGTPIADGGLPIRYHKDGTAALSSSPKEERQFGGKAYVLEHAIRCQFALVHAAVADSFGNLVFHRSARNFNPLCAMAAETTIVEAEKIVEPGDLDADEIHLSGIFVQRVVPLSGEFTKPIERLTLSGE